MIEFVNIRSILNRVPPAIREEESDVQLLSWALQGFRELNYPILYRNEVVLLKLENHKVQLPDQVKIINSVCYMESDPCQEDIISLCDTIENEEEVEECKECSKDFSENCSGSYLYNYKFFLESNFYNNNFIPLKYIGNSKLCPNCMSEYYRYCKDTFSVDVDKILTSSICDGYICVDYQTEVKKDGNYMIPKISSVLEYVSSYAVYKHWENRAMMHEQNGLNFLESQAVKTDMLYRKAKGDLVRRSLRKDQLQTAFSNGDPVFLFSKLPSIYTKRWNIT